MPSDPVNSSALQWNANDGCQLPYVHCAFRDCTFSVHSLIRNEHDNTSDADHPYDQILRRHVQDMHSDEIVSVSNTFLCQEKAKANIWDLYKGALSYQERLRIPVSGKSIDRRTFAHLAHVCNDNRVRSLMCFLCDQVKMDTGDIRSDISFQNARWLFSLPVGSLVKNFSMNRFNAKYRKPGSPLVFRGSDHSVDFSHNTLRLHPEDF